MKLKHFLITLSVPVILYLAGSFIAMDLNPKNWEEVGRTIFVAFSIFISAMCMVQLNENK